MVQATKSAILRKFKVFIIIIITTSHFSMMICQGCGVENNPGTSFCHGCGSKLVSQPGSLAASPGQASLAPCEGAEISCRHSFTDRFSRLLTKSNLFLVQQLGGTIGGSALRSARDRGPKGRRRRICVATFVECIYPAKCCAGHCKYQQ